MIVIIIMLAYLFVLHSTYSSSLYLNNIFRFLLTNCTARYQVVYTFPVYCNPMNRHKTVVRLHESAQLLHSTTYLIIHQHLTTPIKIYMQSLLKPF